MKPLSAAHEASFGADFGGAGSDRLNGGETLGVNQYLLSPNMLAQLILQTDGNLVLVKTDENRPLWSSKTNGSAAAFLSMQADGNVVLSTATNSPKWASGTQGHPNASLVLQDDGNLVVYADGKAYWASNTQGFNSQLHAGEFEWSDVGDRFKAVGDAAYDWASDKAGSFLASPGGALLLNFIPIIGPAAATIITALGPVSTIIPGLLQGQSVSEAALAQLTRAYEALGGDKAAADTLAKELPLAVTTYNQVAAYKNMLPSEMAARLNISIPSAEVAYGMAFGQEALATMKKRENIGYVTQEKVQAAGSSVVTRANYSVSNNILKGQSIVKDLPPPPTVSKMGVVQKPGVVVSQTISQVGTKPNSLAMPVVVGGGVGALLAIGAGLTVSWATGGGLLAAVAAYYLNKKPNE